ncbi:MAG: S41 family peptidase [Kiritimatiellia bacterium]|nr:S41 family peptidase [Kiritimatiellia bacterium]
MKTDGRGGATGSPGKAAHRRRVPGILLGFALLGGILPAGADEPPCPDTDSPEIEKIAESAAVEMPEDGLAPGADEPLLSPFQLAEQLVARLNATGIPIRNEGAAREAIEAILRTGDPGARVVDDRSLEAIRADRDGRNPTFGMELEFRDRQWILQRVDPEGVAAEAGLSDGDLLESLNSRYVSGREPEQIRSLLTRPGLDPVSLAVLTPGAEQSRTVTLTPGFDHPPAADPREIWPRQIVYLRIHAVREGLHRAISDPQTEPGIGVILDLRDAGGESAEEAFRVARALGAKSLPTLESSLDGESVEFEATNPPLVAGSGPVLLLIGPRTRGAAALLAASVRGCAKTLLLGEAAVGDPLLRDAVALEPGWWMWIATRRMKTPDGPTLEAGGAIEPDIPVSGTLAPATPVPEIETFFMESHPRKSLDLELKDRQLAERIGTDATLRRAADILLAMHALSGVPR